MATTSDTVRWADFLISAVRYTADRNRISKARVHEDLGTTVGHPFEESRSDVIKKLEAGKTYCTIIQSTSGNWKKGQTVHVAVVDGDKFIRTDRNSVKQDNLGELPEF